MNKISKEYILSNIKVDKKGCWIWAKGKSSQGYGVISFSKYSSALAHRISYAVFIGEIEKGKLVCHSCDVRDCVNPKHLFLGTHYENTMDAVRKKRLVPPATAYIKGVNASASKLTKKDILKIRKSKLMVKELAKIFNVHRDTISSILKKKTYKDV